MAIIKHCSNSAYQINDDCQNQVYPKISVDLPLVHQDCQGGQENRQNKLGNAATNEVQRAKCG